MSMQQIRDRYGVPAKRGARVEFEGHRGTIVGSDGHRLRIRLDARYSASFHPLWHIDYLDGVDYGARYDEREKAFMAALNRRSEGQEARA